MRYHILLLVALTFNAIQPMDKFKEKLNNFSERITNSSFIDKDKISEKLSSFASFLNNGMNRLVELTIRNDNYTTKEKITVGAGTAGFIALFTTARWFSKKSNSTKISATKKEDAQETKERALKEKHINKQIEILNKAIDLEYTMNGALNNLSAKNISNYIDFLTSLDAIHDQINDFLPHHRADDSIFIEKCHKQLNIEAMQVLELLDKKSKNYQEVINNIHLGWRLNHYYDTKDHRELREQLEEMQFAVKHPPVQA